MNVVSCACRKSYPRGGKKHRCSEKQSASRRENNGSAPEDRETATLLYRETAQTAERSIKSKAKANISSKWEIRKNNRQRCTFSVEKITNMRVKIESMPCRQFVHTGQCSYGTRCRFDHKAVSLRKTYFKTQPCKHLASPQGCPYGDACRYIHPKPKASATKTHTRSRLRIFVQLARGIGC